MQYQYNKLAEITLQLQKVLTYHPTTSTGKNKPNQNHQQEQVGSSVQNRTKPNKIKSICLHTKQEQGDSSPQDKS